MLEMERVTKATRASLSLMICLLLLGCAAEMQAAKMKSALNPYVGRSIAEYILARGPPTNVVDMGAKKRGFQWQITGQTAGAVVPISGMLVAVPPEQTTCRVSLIAATAKASPSMSDWIIENWEWAGEC